MDRRATSKLVLSVLTAAALYACFLLFRPYVTPVLFASVVAIVFYPLHKYMRRAVHHKTMCALLSTLITILLTVVPLGFLVLAISNELTGVYQSLAAKSAGAGGMVPYLMQSSERLSSWFTHRFSLPAIDLRGVLLNRLEGMSFPCCISARAWSAMSLL